MAATLAVRSALHADAELGTVFAIASGGLITVFALWWLYFAQDVPRRLAGLTTAMLWGYGHYLVSRQRRPWAPVSSSTSPMPLATAA